MNRCYHELKVLRGNIGIIVDQKAIGGNSLVQWLGLGAITALGPGSIPGWVTKIPQAPMSGQKKYKKKAIGTKALP